jgi:xylonate dehydratase
MTQNAAWAGARMRSRGPQYLIVSTLGGLRAEDGRPGGARAYHTGHWEIGLLVRAAAEALRAQGALPFAAYCSDPCDGRTQGTSRHVRQPAVPQRRRDRHAPADPLAADRAGVMGIATCDKGLPATMLALAGSRRLPGVIVPGGVTLPARGRGRRPGADLGARFAHDLISLDYAAEMGCRACGSAGGGCQFLGTAATSQVVAEALGHRAAAQRARPVGRAGLAGAGAAIRARAAAPARARHAAAAS